MAAPTPPAVSPLWSAISCRRPALWGRSTWTSFEDWAVENLVQRLPADTRAWFYRSHQCAEIDLLIERGGRPQIALEVKRSSAPSPGEGFAQACDDLGVAQRWSVCLGAERYLSLLTLRGNLVLSSAPQCMKWPSCNCLLDRCSRKTLRPVVRALLLGDLPH